MFTPYWNYMHWKLNMHLRALAELRCLKELWFLNEKWQGIICMYSNLENWNLVFMFSPKASRIQANLSCALDVNNSELHSILILLWTLKKVILALLREIWMLKTLKYTDYYKSVFQVYLTADCCCHFLMHCYHLPCSTIYWPHLSSSVVGWGFFTFFLISILLFNTFSIQV